MYFDLGCLWLNQSAMLGQNICNIFLQTQQLVESTVGLRAWNYGKRAPDKVLTHW